MLFKLRVIAAMAAFIILLGSQASAVQAGPPILVRSVPASGMTDADPATTAIIAVFDQDMSTGMSWTGGEPYFPEVTGDGGYWQDKRTCVLPVELEAGNVYRVGINAPSFQNFRNEAGEPAAIGAILFATAGADPATAAMVKPPKPVSFDPPNGASNVDPSITEISVTFDQPMGGGYSWVDHGKYPEGEGESRWSADKRTCTKPVSLRPGRKYKLGINSLAFQNFSNEMSLPAEPVAYTFKTAGGGTPGTTSGPAQSE